MNAVLPPDLAVPTFSSFVTPLSSAEPCAIPEWMERNSQWENWWRWNCGSLHRTNHHGLVPQRPFLLVDPMAVGRLGKAEYCFVDVTLSPFGLRVETERTCRKTSFTDWKGDIKETDLILLYHKYRDRSVDTRSLYKKSKCCGVLFCPNPSPTLLVTFVDENRTSLATPILFPPVFRINKKQFHYSDRELDS